MTNSIHRWLLLPLGLLASVAMIVCFSLALYQPDRPVATIAPGTSSSPAFVVQIIRPRLGLPLGGVVPPRLFGLEAHLGFDSASAGASIGGVGPRRVELRSDDWDLVLVRDTDGRVTPETRVVFDFLFEEHLQKVRCRPGDPAVGTFDTIGLTGADGLSGSFDIELVRCEYTDTGKPLGWPPKPLVLHGSFDKLPFEGVGPSASDQPRDGKNP